MSIFHCDRCNRLLSYYPRLTYRISIHDNTVLPLIKPKNYIVCPQCMKKIKNELERMK